MLKGGFSKTGSLVRKALGGSLLLDSNNQHENGRGSGNPFSNERFYLTHYFHLTMVTTSSLVLLQSLNTAWT